MTADRLEELARIAEAITTDGYDPSLNGDLLDLARCARGWAKVERLADRTWLTTKDVHGFSLDTCWDESGHPTALEAVEAAEVKP